MKKFVILNYTAAGMGGGQIYLYNKLRYMKEQGYETYCFYAVDGPLTITALREVATLRCFALLNDHPLVLRRKEVIRCVDEMAAVLSESCTELIVECNQKTTGLWGEMLAERLGGFSYYLIIDEKIGSVDVPLMEFFRFKKQKDELKGIENNTYDMLFRGTEPMGDYSYRLAIPGNNVVADVDCDLDFIRNPPADLKLCSIGRLDKPYVPILTDEMVTFAQRHPEKKIRMVWIGDSPVEADKTRIIRSFQELPNVQLSMPGSMFPIPEKLLHEFDVFLSASGSAWVSGVRGLPTISIDVQDFQSIGIFQYDTHKVIFRDKEPQIPVSEKLEYLLNHYDEICAMLHAEADDDFEALFARHIDYYRTHETSGEYYDILSMKLSSMKRMEKTLYRLLGRRAYERIRLLVFSRM